MSKKHRRKAKHQQQPKPPADGEPIGDDRARELVQRLREIARPVLEDAENDLQARLHPGAEIVRGGAKLRYIANHAFSPGMRSLCVGTVYQTRSGDPASNSIQLHRDGVLRWRRDR